MSIASANVSFHPIILRARTAAVEILSIHTVSSFTYDGFNDTRRILHPLAKVKQQFATLLSPIHPQPPGKVRGLRPPGTPPPSSNDVLPSRH